MLSIGFTSCQSRSDSPEKELTALFASTTSLSGDGYNELILQSVMKSMSGARNVTLHVLKPDSIAEARAMFDAWQAKEIPDKALILCGQEYEPLVEGVELSSGRVLLLDSKNEYASGISTALLKRYGGAWLAGAITKDFRPLLLKGLDGDRTIDVLAQGFADGHKAAGGDTCCSYVLAEGYEGMNMPDELFRNIFYIPEASLAYVTEVLLVPLCGTSRLGAFSYSRNFYYGVIGVGEDCYAYSDCLPFSLLLDIGAVVSDYIAQWEQGKPWAAHAEYGLATGHVSVCFNERFAQSVLGKLEQWPVPLEAWRELETQYRTQALEKEADYAY